MPKAGAILLVLACVAGVFACARERVEVGESDAGSIDDAAPSEAGSPIFPIGDGAPDVSLSTCGPPPPIGRCQPCPTGYVTFDDGGATCECCP